MELKIESKHLGDVWVLAPQVFQDDRGFFTETFRADQFEAWACRTSMLQDNHSAPRRAWCGACIFSGNRRWES